MLVYLFEVAYTTEALKKLISKPEDRAEAVRKAIEKLGGKLLGIWLAFGEYDVVSIIEMPDNVTTASFALAVGAGGSCRTTRTTPLLTIEESLAAFRKASKSPYKPIGKK